MARMLVGCQLYFSWVGFILRKVKGVSRGTHFGGGGGGQTPKTISIDRFIAHFG